MSDHRILTDDERERLCDSDSCVRHGYGTVCCPIRRTEQLVLLRLRETDE